MSKMPNFKITDLVYLRTDPDQLERIITAKCERYNGYVEYELDWSVKDGIPITSVAVEVEGKWYLKSEIEENRQNRIMHMWKYEFPSKEDFLSLNAKNQNELLYDIVRGLCERHGFPKP